LALTDIGHERVSGGGSQGTVEMSTGGIGSTTSFWQQDQSYWNDQQSYASSAAASDSLINAISTAETNQGKGLAAIANQTALNRVNSQLAAAIQSVLSGTALSTPSSGTTNSSSSSSSASTPGSPATGTGKDPVTIGTSLSTLGIPAGGVVTITAGGNTTTYTSTGSDTVGDMMNAINTDSVGNAAVTASLNKTGDLVLTGKNDTNIVMVGGNYASNIGFGVGNNTFKPTAPSSSSNASTTSSSTASSTASSTTKSTTSSKSTTAVTSIASLSASSAASLLADSGVSGSLVDMLA
jgi:trimeric autotransporter adhesin